ncbi:hypothetical protein BKK79_35965 [Cupriavidus sp. USMAA2-4]|uniref:hypothetical protein n=1 Tax=Cupriavidus sp. USMAA2-4 TaxID=876364 RepID=UPI0008A6E397|nr:hypothetical protein [Cupriavidus sp. USMAA2-4]AOY96926.1 hypothetical protein BKK79_20260 [Cupriavidus sp. USMAA2-4]AOY97391.1 hypothetical protein BKK79_35965 [Cupriavidus sp. USMAA2-4]
MSAATATLEQMRAPAVREPAPVITMGFATSQSFELMQRAANLLASSTLVPAAYRKVIEKLDKYGNVKESRENPNALANAVVALNMAQRMGADPLMVMQNLYIVEGRPSWSSQWIIAAVNGCGRFSPLRFDIKALGKKTVERTETVWENGNRSMVTKKVDIIDKVCVAWAIERETQERLESPPVTIEMAVKEGWYTKTGSKWQTMDEVMLRYRTASFFGKLYAPELLMGLQSVEEAQEIIDLNPDGSYTVPAASVNELRGAARQAAAQPAQRAEVVEAQDDAPATTTAAEEQEPASAAESGQQDDLLPPDEGDPGTTTDAAGARTFQEVNRELLGAKSVEDLDYARSLIRDVADEKEKAALNQVAARRMRELAPPADAEPAAAAQTTRRSRTPVNAD